MKKVVLETTMKCGGCVDKIKGKMDEISSLESWNVHLDRQPVALEFTGEGHEEKRVLEILREAGFEGKKKGGFFKKILG